MPVLVLGPAGGRVSPDSAGAKAEFIYPAGIINYAGERRMAFRGASIQSRRPPPMLIAKNAAPVYPQEYPIVGIGVLFVGCF
jgi:hypothetical protein